MAATTLLAISNVAMADAASDAEALARCYQTAQRIGEEHLKTFDTLDFDSGLKAGFVQCIITTGRVCPDAKKNKQNQLPEHYLPRGYTPPPGYAASRA